MLKTVNKNEYENLFIDIYYKVKLGKELKIFK